MSGEELARTSLLFAPRAIVTTSRSGNCHTETALITAHQRLPHGSKYHPWVGLCRRDAALSAGNYCAPTGTAMKTDAPLIWTHRESIPVLNMDPKHQKHSYVSPPEIRIFRPLSYILLRTCKTFDRWIGMWRRAMGSCQMNEPSSRPRGEKTNSPKATRDSVLTWTVVKQHSISATISTRGENSCIQEITNPL